MSKEAQEEKLKDQHDEDMEVLCSCHAGGVEMSDCWLRRGRKRSSEAILSLKYH